MLININLIYVFNKLNKFCFKCLEKSDFYSPLKAIKISINKKNSPSKNYKTIYLKLINYIIN